MVVVMEGSEETTAPCRFQVSFKGSSPFVMEQVIWAKLPSSMVSEPNEKADISGGSVEKIILLQYQPVSRKSIQKPVPPVLI